MCFLRTRIKYFGDFGKKIEEKEIAEKICLGMKGTFEGNIL